MRRNSVLLMMLAMATLAGCGGRFTRTNYDTIRPGMPAAEVVRTLGPPDATFERQWIYVHNDPYYKAHILIEDDKVVDKAWHTLRPGDAPGSEGIPAEENPAVRRMIP